jgi:hypothetical protein
VARRRALLSCWSTVTSADFPLTCGWPISLAEDALIVIEHDGKLFREIMAELRV